MGICISSVSSEIHDTEDVQENAVLIVETDDKTKRNGSVHSRTGSKGLNQDAAILYQGYGKDDGTFCGVFDGHGKNGHLVSKLVRNHLPLLVLNQRNSLANAKVTAVHDDCDQGSMPSKNFQAWRDSCISAFKVMDKEIKLQEGLDCSTSGSTAVVVIRQGEDLVIANLGDSRAVLGTLTEDGLRTLQLTTDLKPNVPSEADRIRKCNGRVLALKEEPHIRRVWLPHEDMPGLAMSRAFGDYLLKNHGIIAIPDISYHRITPKDQFIVLATDGVWDVLDNNEVATVVGSAKDEEDAAKALVEAAIASWKKKFPSSKVDDCSVACLFLHKRQRTD
ncbi:probable protein phosphatase 2C 72 [Rhodamnia argentea]|uniref:Probable protein phosphatase 2C 72 n=1 Tax=Rhodamnia argentea TaxID=178133 RepID=A0A8B8P719_9MYRT|nr:probable protein phosphatase 2C 72 [Rhodamnia argentea]XP_048133573.1 probable protein phosphatase 2C 72 [Rhodamnia argentea]